MATVIRGDDNFDTADNATQTELDSGLAGKLDTTADVGKILQIAMSGAVGTTAVTSTSLVEPSTGWRVTMSNVKANSILFYNVEANTETDGAAFGKYKFQILEPGAGSWTDVQYSHVSGNSENFVVQNISLYFVNPSTVDGTITMRMLYQVSTGNQTFNDSGPGITGITSKATLIEYSGD